MKNQLSDIYDQILLSEAEKHSLQNPSSDEVGNLPKENVFSSKPKPVEGAEKAKVQKGPEYKTTTGESSAPKASSSSMPKSAPAKSEKGEEPEEMEDTDVDPTEKKKEKTHKESFTMSAFETLFKKTLNEEAEEAPVPAMDGAGEVSGDANLDADLDTDGDGEASEEELEEEEGDLISDLKELQDKLASILDKLEDIHNAELEQEAEEEYTEDEFDSEFDDSGESDDEEEEGAPMGESLKPLNSSKGKSLMSKKNKVGKLSAKGGKAKGASLKNQPNPTALGDKKKVLQNKSNKVKSSVTKGEFFK